MVNQTKKLITIKDVMLLTGYKSPTSIYNLLKDSSTLFPRPRRLPYGGNRWELGEVQVWIASLQRA